MEPGGPLGEPVVDPAQRPASGRNGSHLVVPAAVGHRLFRRRIADRHIAPNCRRPVRWGVSLGPMGMEGPPQLRDPAVLAAGARSAIGRHPRISEPNRCGRLASAPQRSSRAVRRSPLGKVHAIASRARRRPAPVGCPLRRPGPEPDRLVRHGTAAFSPTSVLPFDPVDRAEIEQLVDPRHRHSHHGHSDTSGFSPGVTAVFEALERRRRSASVLRRTTAARRGSGYRRGARAAAGLDRPPVWNAPPWAVDNRETAR